MSVEKDKLFEERLRTARPLSPHPRLKERIDASISQIDRKRAYARWRVITGWAGLATAAAALITFGLLLFNGRIAIEGGFPDSQSVDQPPLTVNQEAGKDEFQPVLAENNLKERIDEGIVFLDNGLTARRYRYEFIDRVVWRNPSDGAIVEMEIPREEYVLIPVQTF